MSDFEFDPMQDPSLDPALNPDFGNFDFGMWTNDVDPMLTDAPNGNMPVDSQISNGNVPAPAFDSNMNPMTFGNDNGPNGMPNLGVLPDVPLPNAPVAQAPAGNMSPFDFTHSSDRDQANPFNFGSNGLNVEEPSINPQVLATGNTVGQNVDHMGPQIPMAYPSQGVPQMAFGLALQGQYPVQRAHQPTSTAPGAGQHAQPVRQSYDVPYNFNTWKRWGQASPESPTASGQMGSNAPLPTLPTNAAPEGRLPTSTPTLNGRTILAKSPDDLADEDDVLSEPDSPLLTRKQPAKKKKSKQKKSVSKAKQEAVKFPIVTDQLLISGLAEANRVTIKRIPLKVVDDDRDAVAANPELWIHRITTAFEHDYIEKSEDDARLTKEGRAEFSRWQKEHFNKTWSIFTEHKDDVFRFLQACAYIFYDLVLEAHEPGNGLHHVSKTISNGGADVYLKCSQRLKGAIKALKQYSIVKYDFLKQERLDGLAASPSGFVHRKVENMFVNYKKKKGSGPVRKDEGSSSSNAKGKKRESSSPESSPGSSPDPELTHVDSDDEPADESGDEDGDLEQEEVDYDALDQDGEKDEDEESSGEGELVEDSEYDDGDTIVLARPLKRLSPSKQDEESESSDEEPMRDEESKAQRTPKHLMRPNKRLRYARK